MMLDLIFSDPACQLVISLAITQIKARLQLRAETITDVRRHTLAAATGMVLITVGIGVIQGNVVIQIAQYLPRTDLALLIAVTACLIPHLQRGGVVAGMGDVVDRAAQCQCPCVKTIGAAQDFGAAKP